MAKWNTESMGIKMKEFFTFTFYVPLGTWAFSGVHLQYNWEQKCGMLLKKSGLLFSFSHCCLAFLIAGIGIPLAQWDSLKSWTENRLKPITLPSPFSTPLCSFFLDNFCKLGQNASYSVYWVLYKNRESWLVGTTQQKQKQPKDKNSLASKKNSPLCDSWLPGKDFTKSWPFMLSCQMTS